MNAHPAKVCEAICTHRLACFKADQDHFFGEPILGEFLFGPDGLIGGNELHLLVYNKRIQELDTQWENALYMKKETGAELSKHEMAFLNQYNEPGAWKKILDEMG